MEPGKQSSGRQGSGMPQPPPAGAAGKPPIAPGNLTPEGIAATDPLYGSPPDTRVLALEAQVQELTAQVGKLTDLAARAQADLQNAKTRMQKDGDDLRRYAAESIIKRLLPVVDNFQRAFAHLPLELKDHEWVRGVFGIEQDLLKQLTELGLKKMEVMGQQADTARHEVLMVGPGEEGMVIEVFEEGYELHGKVLRPAKVKVGGGGEGK